MTNEDVLAICKALTPEEMDEVIVGVRKVMEEMNGASGLEPSVELMHALGPQYVGESMERSVAHAAACAMFLGVAIRLMRATAPDRLIWPPESKKVQPVFYGQGPDTLH